MTWQKLCAVYILLLVLPLQVAAQNDPVAYPSTKLSIKTPRGVISLNVEIAATPLQQEHGLMFRKHMARDHGMLFVFPQSHYVEFWMKNTLIPLDMVFVDNSGIVTKVTANATPLSLAPIPSDSDATRAVLELNGGAARHYHIAKGAKLLYSFSQ